MILLNVFVLYKSYSHTHIYVYIKLKLNNIIILKSILSYREPVDIYQHLLTLIVISSNKVALGKPVSLSWTFLSDFCNSKCNLVSCGIIRLRYIRCYEIVNINSTSFYKW